MAARFLSAFFPLIALPHAALGPAAEPVVEAAAAGRVNASGRDAFFMISEDGDALIGFIPEGKDGWSRRMFVSVGPGVAAFALADFDGDGILDLAVVRRDRSFALWRGDGEGRFELKFNSRRELPWVPAALAVTPDGRRSPPDLLATGADGARLRLRNDGFGVFDRGDSPASVETAARGNRTALMLALNDLPVTVAPDGRIIRKGTPDAAPIPWRIPFAIRAAAAGDFDGDGTPDLALAGYGARPEFAFIPGRLPSGAVSAAGAPLFQPALPATDFTVSGSNFVFAPATININVNDRIAWTFTGFPHTATSTAASTGCTACTAVGAGCPDPFNLTVSGVFNTFAAAGTQNYICSNHCLSGMRGVINIAAPPASPGTVPDGGTPFKLKKNATVATNLDLSWGASCGAATTGYEVYQGTLPIGGTYNHAMLNCALGNVTAATVTPGAGNTYYLLVPRSASQEGSYGKNSAGAQIPAATTGQCVAQNLTGAC